MAMHLLSLLPSNWKNIVKGVYHKNIVHGKVNVIYTFQVKDEKNNPRQIFLWMLASLRQVLSCRPSQICAYSLTVAHGVLPGVALLSDVMQF